jgi:hypothetical protein
MCLLLYVSARAPVGGCAYICGGYVCVHWICTLFQDVSAAHCTHLDPAPLHMHFICWLFHISVHLHASTNKQSTRAICASRQPPCPEQRQVNYPTVNLVMGVAEVMKTHDWHVGNEQAVALPLFSGILAGYLSYDCIHYAIHHGGRLPTRWLMHLRSAHLSHHYRDPDTGYGISSDLFDVVFRTCVPPRS